MCFLRLSHALCWFLDLGILCAGCLRWMELKLQIISALWFFVGMNIIVQIMVKKVVDINLMGT